MGSSRGLWSGCLGTLHGDARSFGADTWAHPDGSLALLAE